MIDTLHIYLPSLDFKHADYIHLPCIEIFHLITRVHGSVPLRMYLRPQVDTEEMQGFHCTDFDATHNYSMTFFFGLMIQYFIYILQEILKC